MQDRIVIGGDLKLNKLIDGDMNLSNVVDGQPDKIFKGGTNNHNVLINRDLPDQHPISAITRLESELEARPDERLTNSEIYTIMQA